MKKTVLLVEDDPSWRFNYEEILSDEGFSVVTASSKEDALGKLDKDSYDIAIVDLRLVDSDPRNNDGIEVIKKLRQLSKDMPIIVKSGYLDPEIKKQLQILRIDDRHILDKLDEHGQMMKLANLLQSFFKNEGLL